MPLSTRLLDSIFEICGVPPDKFRTICSAVDKVSTCKNPGGGYMFIVCVCVRQLEAWEKETHVYVSVCACVSRSLFETTDDAPRLSHTTNHHRR